MTAIAPIVSADLERLRAFRRVARQVAESSVMVKGLSLRLDAEAVDERGFRALASSLFEQESFRSLMMSLRLVYQKGSPAHFYSVCSIAWRHAPEPSRTRIAKIRRYFSRHLTGLIEFRYESKVLRPGEMLETWMNAEAFHLDTAKQGLLDALNEYPTEFQFFIQVTALTLCDRVIDLDEMIADLIGEPAAPRHGARRLP